MLSITIPILSERAERKEGTKTLMKKDNDMIHVLE